jgi:hypothetical protein
MHLLLTYVDGPTYSPRSVQCDGVAREFGPIVVDVFTSRFISNEEVCVHFLLCPESAATTRYVRTSLKALRAMGGVE